MADKAANTIYECLQRGETDSFALANGVTFYLGMFCNIESGYLNHWNDDGTSSFCGVLVRCDSRLNDGVYTGNTSDTPPPEGSVNTSGMTLVGVPVAGATAVGELVYCADSDPANMLVESSGRNDPIGVIKRFVSASDCDVKLFSWMEHLAQQTA